MRLVVDSGCGYTDEMIKNEGIDIEMVPLTLQIEDTQYIDDGTVNIDEFLNAMESSQKTTKSAAPSPKLFYDKYIAGGSVFVVTLSSHISASYNNALIAKQMYLDEVGKKFIHVFDSWSGGAGQTIISLKINELIKQKLSENEIVDGINKFIGSMKTYLLIENFNNIVKNGRINPYIAKISQMLSIKPIIGMPGGKLAMVDKARGNKNLLEKILNIIEKEKVDFENRILGITHVKCLEKALFFKEEISKRFIFKDVIIVEASALAATYGDRHGILIAY